MTRQPDPNHPNNSKGQLKFRSPLVPQWVPFGDGWIVGVLIRSAFYRRRPRVLISSEDMSDFYHAFDE
jgi:hypothetical protein